MKRGTPTNRGRGSTAQRGQSRGRGGSRGGSNRGNSRGHLRGKNNINNNNKKDNNNSTKIDKPRPRPQFPKEKVDFQAFEALEREHVISFKKEILAEISTILIRESADTKNKLKKQAVLLSHYDPEFLLKVVLYARDDLNMRAISNYMLAVCANLPNCQPYLKKYLPAIVRLPSDWLGVIDAFLSLPERYTDQSKSSLPNALRNALTLRFLTFDLYQLGKYNKEKAILKKQKKLAEKTGLAIQKMTLKKAIKILHISEPRFPVLAILGKKYPKDPEEWKKLGLYQDFDVEKAGKRIKLPIAETWETLLSAKGNKGPTWEELIEHKKLPFMAMLRNLRNLLFTGVAPRYHRWAINKLTSPSAIAMSRQFPFRFLNAYNAIPKDLEDFKKQLQEINGIYPNNNEKEEDDEDEDDEDDLIIGDDDDEEEGEAPAVEEEKKKRRRPRKNPIVCQVWPTKTLFAEYRTALETSIKLATIQNLKPIGGRSAIFISPSNSVCGTSGSLGTVQKVNEVAVLLGLMLTYATELGEFFMLGEEVQPLSVTEGSILENIQKILQSFPPEDEAEKFPFDYLCDALNSKKRLENLIVIGTNFQLTNDIETLLSRYRELVYPGLLFVSIDLTGKQIGIKKLGDSDPNNVLISGFSDAILRFVAERGDSSQLAYIENIDKSKPLVRKEGKQARLPAFFGQLEQKIKFQKKERTNASQALDEEDQDDDDNEQEEEEEEEELTIPRRINYNVKPWKTAKIFISSTFLDMHGERDILTRVVFPELRERCKKIHVNLLEVDLRWGVTQEDTENNMGVQICLEEVDRCSPFFVCLLGERYGWAPAEYNPPDDKHYDWVREYPKGRSVTELEIQAGALRLGSDYSRALFYFRDATSYRNLPTDLHSQFFSDQTAQQKLKNLKQEIEGSDFPIFNYVAEYGGTKDNKPMMSKLEIFAEQVKKDLWGQICEYFIESATPEEDAEDLFNQQFDIGYHDAWMEIKSQNFLGRQDYLKNLNQLSENTLNNIVAVIGSGGSGKSALMSKFARSYIEEHPNVFVICHFVGAAPDSTDIRKTLLRISGMVVDHFSLQIQLGEDYQEICQQFAQVIKTASYKQKIVLILDGIDQFKATNRAHSLDWLPIDLPIKIFASCLSESLVTKTLLQKINHQAIHVGPLTPDEKAVIVRETLAQYNKKLDESPMNDQMRPLLKKVDSTKPLYLNIACHELRVFGVYEQLEEKIQNLPQTIHGLCQSVLHRLEGDLGADWVRDVVCLLLTTRGGLLEQEICCILKYLHSHKHESAAHFRFDQRIPRSKWAITYSSLEPFLRPAGLEDDGCIDLFHREFKASAAKHYLNLTLQTEAKTSSGGLPRASAATGPSKAKLSSEQIFYHKTLAFYFLYIYRQTRDHSAHDSISTRAISELPHHLLQSQQYDQFTEIVTSLDFIKLKFKIGAGIDLIEDYQEALSLPPEITKNFEKFSLIQEYSQFIFSNSHILKQFPELTLQQAINQPDFTQPAKDAQRIQLKASTVQPWVKWETKPQMLDQCRMTLPQTTGITAVTSLSDQSFIAATQDSTATTFGTHTGTEIGTLVGHSNYITCIAASPDNQRLVTSSLDESLKVWDASTCNLLFSIDKHDRRVSGCKFSLDGKYIISSSWDRTIRLFISFSGEEVHCFKDHDKPINTFALSEDGNTIASGDWRGAIKLWNINERTLISTITELPELANTVMSPIRCLQFNPNGNQIFAGTIDGSIKVYDLKSRTMVSRIFGHTSAINSCSFSSSLKFATGSEDSTISIWSAYLGQQLASHSSQTRKVHIAASLDGGTLALAGGDGEIELWAPTTLKKTATLQAHSLAVNCTLFIDANTLASCSDDTKVMLWDIPSRKLSATLSGHVSEVQCLAFLKGTKRFLASASFDTKVIIWDIDTKKRHKFLNHQSPVKACAFSPDKRFLATGGSDSLVYLWSTFNWSISRVLKGHQDWVNCLCFSPDSLKLVSGSWDFTLRVWTVAERWQDSSFDDTKIEKKTWPLEGHMGSISSCYFSDKFIYSTSFDGTIKVWNIKGGGEYTTLGGHQDKVIGHGFISSLSSHDQLVSVDESGEIKVWNPIDSEKLGTLQGHSKGVSSVAFTSDANQLISGSEDASIKVWDIKQATNTQSELAEAHHIYTREARSVAWSPDFSFILADFPTHIKAIEWGSNSLISSIPKKNVTAPYRSIQTTFDGEYFVAAQERTLLAYNLMKRESLNQIDNDDIISTATAHPEKWDVVATGDWGNQVKLWNIRTSSVIPLASHSDWVTCSNFSSFDLYLSTGSYDKTAIVQDYQKKKKIITYTHDAPVTALFSTEQYFATGTNTGKASLFAQNHSSTSPIATLEDLTNGQTTVNDLVITPDQNYLITATSAHNGYISVFDLRMARQVSKFVSHSPLRSISFKDLSTILVTNTEGVLHLSLQNPDLEFKSSKLLKKPKQKKGAKILVESDDEDMGFSLFE